MNRAIGDADLVRRYSIQMHGVFSTGDLSCLFGEASGVVLHRRINTLESSGIITRFSRGFYVSPDFNTEALTGRIIENSYLSMGTVLAKEMMIGSTPVKTAYAVRIGNNRRFVTPDLTIEYVGIAKDLYFGYKVTDGIRYATGEKALLDTLYFHLHGRAFSFDIYQDIDISRIDHDLIVTWLEKYRNPRFISFVKGYLDDRR